ncbi:hypothetical protein H1R20_g12851, partial [Candolleomyces eurysporus]
MPNIRPGWMPKQSIYIRIAAIEFLRVGHTGHRGQAYLDMFFEEWLAAHGIPPVPEGSNLDDVLNLYKARLVSTIRWHAFAGSGKLDVLPATRIRSLKSRLKRDLFFLWDSPPQGFIKVRKPSSATGS